MTEEEVKQIAFRFVGELDADHERAHGPSAYRRVLRRVMRDARQVGQWAVVFGLETPKGNPVDAMAVVLVDDATGEARFVE
jgi:hypothetical protein